MQKKISLRFCAALLAIVLLVITLSNSNVHAATYDMASTNQQFYAVRQLPFILRNGTEATFDTYYYRNDYAIANCDPGYNRIMYEHIGLDNSLDSINSFFGALVPVYCMDVNADDPFSTGSGYYTSSTTTLKDKNSITVASSGVSVDKKGLINLLKNSYYTDYWAENGVSNLGAQIEATQLAIWCITNPSASYTASSFSGNPNYPGTSGVANMINELINCYNNHDYSVTKTKITVIGAGITDNTSTLQYNYSVQSERCYEGSTYSFEYSYDGGTTYIPGLPDGATVTLNNTLINNYSLNTVNGTDYITVSTPKTLENYHLTIHLMISAPETTVNEEMVYYYATSQTGPNGRVRQEMLGFSPKFDRAKGDYALTSNNAPTAKISIFKKDSYDNSPLSNIQFEVKADTPDGAVVATPITDATGYIEFNPEWNRTYCIREVSNGAYRDNAGKIIANGNEFDFPVNSYIQIKANFNDKKFYINDVAVGDMYLQSDNTYTTCSDPSDISTHYVGIYNYRPSITLNISKEDEFGEVISGPEFTLYDENRNIIATTTAQDGDVKFNYSYAWDTQYYIAETKNDGYTRNVTFSVGANVIESTLGTLIPISYDWASQSVNINGTDYNLNRISDAYVSNSANVVITNYTAAQIKLVKVDAENNAIKLQGCVFGLYSDAACTTPVKVNGSNYTVTTDANGEASFDALKTESTYYVKEISTITGYTLSDTITPITTSRATSTEYDNTNCYYIFSITQENQPQHGKIGIDKTGEVLVDFHDGNFVYEYRHVAGITFGLYDNESDAAARNNNYIEKLTTTTADVDYFRTLLKLNHTYYVVELTTIDGLYIGKNPPINEVSFSSQDTYTLIYSRTLQIQNEKQRNTVSTYKYNDLENIPLSGAEFQITANEDIYDYTGDNLLLTRGDIIEKAISDEDGQIVFSCEYPCSYQFTLKESKIPLGFYDTYPDEIFSFVADTLYESHSYSSAIPNTPLIGTVHYEYRPDFESNKQPEVAPDTPDTGDSANIFLYLGLVILAILTLVSMKKKEGSTNA